MDEYVVINRLYFRSNWTSGSLWQHVHYRDGCISKLIGCRFVDKAFGLSRELLPGERIRITDGEIVKIEVDSASWDCWIIKDFEKHC